MKRINVIAATFSAALFLLLGTPAMANAAETAPSVETPPTNAVPMVSGGFRADVAAAHGYKIITNPDGSQSSIPVTRQARDIQAKADADRAAYVARLSKGGGATTNGVVDGPCGSSWINALKQAHDVLTFSTGYVVFGAVVDSRWAIYADALIADNSVILFPGGNSGTWSTEGGLGGVVGPGIATVVNAGSFAILASGQVCYSGGPSASFG